MGDLFSLEEGDDQLISMQDIAHEMQVRGLLNRHRNTYRRWALQGVDVGDRTIKLKTRMVSNVRHTTVQWLHEFLVQQQ